jgi:hypothetical protein
MEEGVRVGSVPLSLMCVVETWGVRCRRVGVEGACLEVVSVDV